MLHTIGAHNSDHAGQVAFLRQLLGKWPPPSGGVTWQEWPDFTKESHMERMFMGFAILLALSCSHAIAQQLPEDLALKAQIRKLNLAKVDSAHLTLHTTAALARVPPRVNA